MYLTIETYFKEVIKGKRSGFFPRIIRIISLPFSRLYQLATRLRNRLYDLKVLRKFTPPVPVVISIGNIVAGGTGKTPITLLLAKELQGLGKMAILSRGYRSPSEKNKAPLLLSTGEGPLYAAKICGDEPYLLSKNVPEALVYVGKNRVHSATLAAKEGASLIILDDAMQYRKLSRDYEVVVLDARDPFGRGFFLPRGFLRDEVASLSRAHMIVVTHAKDEAQFQEVKKKVAQYSAAEVVGVAMQVSGIFSLQGQKLELEEGKKVGVFCSIAHPEYFRWTVMDQKAMVIAESPLSDHEEIAFKKLTAFSDKCLSLGAEVLLCTEKDKVKLPENISLSLPVAWVQTRAQVTYGKENWNQFIESIRKKIS